MCSYSGQHYFIKDFIFILKWKAPIPRKESGRTHALTQKATSLSPETW